MLQGAGPSWARCFERVRFQAVSLQNLLTVSMCDLGEQQSVTPQTCRMNQQGRRTNAKTQRAASLL